MPRYQVQLKVKAFDQPDFVVTKILESVDELIQLVKTEPFENFVSLIQIEE